MKQAIIIFLFIFISKGTIAQWPLGGQWNTYNKSNSGLLDDTVWYSCVDSSNNKWFGTKNGVSKFDGSNWTSYTKADGLSNNDVRCIAIDTSGNKWLGTFGGGVSYYNDTIWKTYTTSDGLANDTVNYIFIDKNEKWFATRSGLSKFDGSNWTSYTKVDGLANDFVWCINKDKNDNFWFGTSNGVSKFDGISWTTYTTADGLINNTVWCIKEDKSGNIWFGTDDGISKYNNLFLQKYYTPPGGGEMIGSVRSFAIDMAGNKWFVCADNAFTGGGVYKFNDSVWLKYVRNSGLANGDVYTICIDKSDNKWVGVFNGGVSNFDDAFILVTEISISLPVVSIEVGSDTILIANITPTNASDKSVKWSTSDKKIASVDTTGKVTGIKEGSCKITITSYDGIITSTYDGYKKSSCNLTVVSKKESINTKIIQTISIYPNPTTGMITLIGDNIIKTEVFDITGRSQGLFYSNQIDLNYFSAGTYILNIYGKEGLIRKEKIILTK